LQPYQAPEIVIYETARALRDASLTPELFRDCRIAAMFRNGQLENST
jgi:hypothetical protein